MNNCVHFVYTHNRDSSCPVCGRSTSCVMYKDFYKYMLLWMATVVNSAYHSYICKADIIIQRFQYVFLACLLSALYKCEWLFVDEWCVYRL